MKGAMILVLYFIFPLMAKEIRRPFQAAYFQKQLLFQLVQLVIDFIDEAVQET